MNNSNSARLIESIKFGDLVTVRDPEDGWRHTGRAEQTATGAWRARIGRSFSILITPDNIVSITRDLS